MMVHLHIVAITHMTDAYENNKPWICTCPGCNYTRETPKISGAFWDSIKKICPQPNPEAKNRL